MALAGVPGTAWPSTGTTPVATRVAEAMRLIGNVRLSDMTSRERALLLAALYGFGEEAGALVDQPREYVGALYAASKQLTEA